jgi:cytochrome P450
MTQTNTPPDPFTATAPGQRLADYRQLAVAPGVRRISIPDGQVAWLVTGSAQVRALFHDPRLGKMVSPTAATATVLVAHIASALNNHMLNALRARNTAGCAAWSVRPSPCAGSSGLAPRIQQIAEELLAKLDRDVATGAGVDLLAEYARPLSMTVIFEHQATTPHRSPSGTIVGRVRPLRLSRYQPQGNATSGIPVSLVPHDTSRSCVSVRPPTEPRNDRELR